VGYWNCDDTAPPTKDSSGNGNDGTWSAGVSALTGAANTPQATPWSTGCLNFNAATAQVSVPGNAQLTLLGDFTVSFWMYPNADAGDYQRLVGKGAGADPASAVNRTFGVWRNPGADHHILFQQYNNGAGVLNITSTDTTPNTAWTHVAARISGNNATLFLNGSAALGATGARSGPPSGVQSDPVTFGYAGFHTSFPGRLDDIRLFNRALSDADIAALAAGSEGAPAPTGLTATAGNNQVTLNWNAGPSGTVYNIKRSTVMGGSPPGTYTTIQSNVSGNSYIDTTATNGTTWYYVISAVTYGESPNSNEVSAHPDVVTAVPNAGLQTTETGGTATFNILFNAAAPAGGSTVTVTSSTPSQGRVSSSGNPTPSPSITIPVAAGFTGPIPITVTGFDDFIVNGNQPYTVSVSATGFAGLSVPPVQLTNLERDTLGILVSKASVTTTTAGGQDSFSVVLNSMPAPNTMVTIAVASSNPTEATVSPATLQFTPGTWNVAQTVTVTGVGVNLTYMTEYYVVTLTVQPSPPAPASPAPDPLYVGLTGPPSGPVQVSGANLHLETPPALPKVWGGGCGLFGLEIGGPLLLLRLRRRRLSRQ